MEKFDFTIKVDRLVKPIYPEHWKVSLLEPDLETTGPREYDLRDIKKWQHAGQVHNTAGMPAKKVYEHLKSKKALPNCLNLQDGQAIKAKGVGIFCELFEPTHLLILPASALTDIHGDKVLPYLYVHYGEVKVGWKGFPEQLKKNSLILRFEFKNDLYGL